MKSSSPEKSLFSADELHGRHYCTTSLKVTTESTQKAILTCSALKRLLLPWDNENKKTWKKKIPSAGILVKTDSLCMNFMSSLTLVSFQCFFITLSLPSATHQILPNSSHHRDWPVLPALGVRFFTCERAKPMQKHLAWMCQKGPTISWPQQTQILPWRCCNFLLSFFPTSRPHSQTLYLYPPCLIYPIWLCFSCFQRCFKPILALGNCNECILCLTWLLCCPRAGRGEARSSHSSHRSQCFQAPLWCTTMAKHNKQNSQSSSALGTH